MNAIMEIPPPTAKSAGYLEVFAVLAMTVGAAIAVGALLPVNFDPAAAPVKQESEGPAYKPEWQGTVIAPTPGPGNANRVATGAPKHVRSSQAGKAHLAKGGSKVRPGKYLAHARGKRVALRFPTRRSAH
jgi:hypothetical protein